MSEADFDTIVANLKRVVGRNVSEHENDIVRAAIAQARAGSFDDLIDFAAERDLVFANAIITGGYLDAMLDVAKEVASSNTLRMLAREEPPLYFLIDSTRGQLERLDLPELTSIPSPDQDEIIAGLRDLLSRTLTTGFVVTTYSTIHVENETEPTTAAQRSLDVLFVLAVGRSGNRSALLPLDGGNPVWHDFPAIARGLERYIDLSTDLVDLVFDEDGNAIERSE